MKTVPSRICLLALRGFSRKDKERIAAALQVGLAMVYEYIKIGSDALTKAGAMEIIREVTGQTDDVLLTQVEIESKAA